MSFSIYKRLIELDARRRASLGKIGLPEHSRYLVHAEPNGTVIMTPVDLVPAANDAEPNGREPATGPAVFWEMARVTDEPADER